ncbi:DUF6115 domain-containing protein [Alkalihalobacillus sp. NPDC078783]
MAVALSILSICLISFLYLRVQSTERKLTELETRLEHSEQTREEMEKSLLVFAEEMKSGNERILSQVSDTKPMNEKSIPKGPVESSETELLHKDYQPPLPQVEQVDTSYQPSTQATIITLEKQGFSTAEIAKRLHMGKGEVDLIIKFQQNAN